MSKIITKNFLQKGAVAMASAFVVFCVFIPVSEASVAPFINYQGKLTDTNGWAVDDGSYDMRFKIYDAVTSGNLLWTGIHTAANGNAVDLSRGIFSLLLGSGAGNTMIDLNNDTYYLQVEIYNTNTPGWEIFNNRKRLGAVPQALNAKNIVSDGFINIDNTSASQDLLNISYNPASGAFNAASIIYGAGGGTGTALSITQEGTGNSFQVNDVSGDTTPFVIDASGKVGIGTTTPGQTLTVAGTLGILETGDTPLYHTIFQGGDQGADITYILPTSNVSGIMRNDAGVLSWTNTQTLPTHAGIDGFNTVTSNGDGTVNVPANTASFYNDAKTEITRISIAANAVLALTDVTANYIVADRDTGTWVATTDHDLIDYVRYLPYSEVYRSGSTVHIQTSPLEGNGLVESAFERVARTNRYARESGLDSISVNSSLETTVSGGTVWAVNTPFVIPSSTSAAGSGTVWFFPHHDSTAWHNQYMGYNPKINNTEYDDGTDRQTLTDGYYTINYIYRGVEGQNHLYIMLGNAQYASVDLAKASSTVSALPDLISSHAMLVGRVIVQKNATSSYVIESAFNTVYAGSSAITSHAALTGLLNDDHTQYALLTGRSGGQVVTGGTVADSTLTISGNNATGNTTTNANLVFKVGDSAGTTAMTILNNGGITLPALGYVDFGSIVHNTTAIQGLRLPQAASATPSNPTSGEGYLAWDTAGNQLIIYNGTSWATVGGGVAQTPWVQDISAAGYDLGSLSNLGFQETTGAPTGTNVGFYRDNTGDLTGNVLTGKNFNLAVNGVDEYNFSSTALAMNSNNITGLGTNLTATGALTIASTGATALNLTANAASAWSIGANVLTVTSSNFNTTSTGINSSAIGATTASTGAFTTLSSTGASTIGTGAGLTNTFGTGTTAANTFGITGGTNAINGSTTMIGTLLINSTGTAATTIGNGTGAFQLTSNGGLNVSTGGALTGVASIDTVTTTSSAFTFPGAGSIASASGNLTLQPAGSGTTATVQIGVGGGTGSATPDLFGLDTKNLTGDPTGFNGAMYYNVADAKFKCFEGGAWKNCDTTSAGGGYATIQDEAGALTQRATVNFTGTGVTCVDNAGATRTDCTIPGGAGGGVSFASGTADNTTGTNNLIQLQKGGLNKFVVANNGGLSIFGSTTNITKTKTGTTNTEDFSLTGSTLTNVTSQNDEIDINSGTVVTTFTSGTATASNAVGAGGHSIVRDDGSVLVISGGNAALAASGSLWNGVSGMMTTKTIAAGATFPGAGAISLKRPNGKYLLIHGNATALTSIYDPWGTAAVAGPAICAGATTGTNAFMRSDGKYVILCGGTTAWGIYDPSLAVTAGYTAGTAVGTAFGAGAHAIARDDGTFLVFAGGTSTAHYLYTPSGTTATTGTMTLNPITTNQPTISTGAFSIRRNDGKYIVVGGAINTSTVYNPTPTSANGGAGSFELINGGVAAAGFGPITTALADAAQAVRRQDGKYLMVHGGASTLTDIIDPSVTTNLMFTAGTALNNAMGTGGHMVPRPDGKYAIVRGGGTAVDTYDMGLVIGGNGSGSQLASYETECITVASLNHTSTLNWNVNAEGAINFQVKTGTGSCSSSYRDIAVSGGAINGATGDNRVQVKVFFKRPFFIGYDQEWALWRGLSQPRYRAKIADPTLYDITINNSSQVHRSQFDLGTGSDSNATATDPSGPVLSNINITSDKLAQLAMTSIGNQALASTVTAISATYNGAVGTHNALATAAAEGTVVIKRPNGTFLVVAGNAATSNAQIYKQDTQTFAANANGVSGAVCSGTGNGSCLPTTGAANTVTGRGALAFKRPNGTFLVVLGGATTVTNIYDPVLSTFTNGPVTKGAVGRGALVIPLPNGRVLIIHGNQLTTTSVYDPVNNVMIAGPDTTVFVGPGSLAIPNTNGTWFISLGVAAAAESATAYTCSAIRTTTNLFDPYAMAFTATTGQPTTTTGTGPGAFAFQRSDGMWMINKGGNVVTTCAAASATAGYQLYNPVTMKLAVGPNSVVGSLSGAHAVQRPNGTWLIFNGGNTATTQIYVENDGAASALAGGAKLGSFTAGPAIAAIGSGALSFQRDDGKYVLLSGATGTSAVAVGTAATAVQQYDAGWISSGAYRSEQLNVADLDANSTLSWRASPDMKGISAEVRTASSQLGLQTASSRDVTSSGGLINGSSDTWLQIQFNFKRTFPSYSNIWADTWWNSGSTSAHTWRTIGNPTLNEFSVNKDINLVDLKSDGLSVFRVSTNGDIFTSNTGSVRTGGADLAENYTSSEPLLPGDVVSIDPLSNHGVKKTNYQYQRDVLGVVSTAPGFVAGSYTEDSYPIALVGRVPVKVSTENGPIHSGDMLTVSSVPGYAMRAVQAGRIIGTAMENLDETKATECPMSEFIIKGRKCGEVMMFVNLVNYLGSPIDVIMAEKNVSADSVEGMTTEESNGGMVVGFASSANGRLAMNASTKQEQILDFLKSFRDERLKNSGATSEVFTDRVSASTEIVTPTLVADQIFAKSIKADSIEGLQIFTDQIKSLSEKYAGLEATSTEANTNSTQSASEQKAFQTAMKNLSTDTITVQLDGSILGKLTVGGALRVGGDTEFAGNTIFGKLATFVSETLFKGKVMFEKAPTFTSNTAGFAIVSEGQKSVDIVFDEKYATQPIVSVSITSDVNPLSNGADETLKKDIQAVEDDSNTAYFSGDVKYIVTKKNESGFTIVLNKKAPRELQFSWVAIAVSGAKVSHSKEEVIASDTLSAEQSSEAVLVSVPAVSPVDTTNESVPLVAPIISGQTEQEATPVAPIVAPIISGQVSALPISDNLSQLASSLGH